MLTAGRSLLLQAGREPPPIWRSIRLSVTVKGHQIHVLAGQPESQSSGLACAALNQHLNRDQINTGLIFNIAKQCSSANCR